MFYKDPKDFITALMDNESKQFGDGYGRRWKYWNFKFYFSDLGESEFVEGLFCLHLYGTGIEILETV